MPCLSHSDAWRAMMSTPDGHMYRPGEPQRSPPAAHRPATKRPEGAVGFFLLDTVSRLDLRRFSAPYAGETRGAPPFDPAMLVCLWL